MCNDHPSNANIILKISEVLRGIEQLKLWHQEFILRLSDRLKPLEDWELKTLDNIIEEKEANLQRET